jgi:mannose-6-phosphate isomerase-like protein (cupin superfamily)
VAISPFASSDNRNFHNAIALVYTILKVKSLHIMYNMHKPDSTHSKGGRMAKAGSKVLDSEGYGLIFRQTSRDTNGELLEMDAFYRPQGKLPPPHHHPAQEEHFEVLDGVFRVHLGDEIRDVHPGDTFIVPMGVTHAMHNIAAEKGHLRWQTRPALNSEGFFEAVWTMETADHPAKRGIGQLLRLAVIFEEYDNEVRLSNKVQRTVLKILAVFAKMVGINARSLLLKKNKAFSIE